MQDEYKISNPKLRQAMLKVFGGKCFYSGQPVTAETMVIDHVVPKAKGGKDSIFNYVLTHQSLNVQKRDVLDEEKVKPILYLIKTAYAPRIIAILHSQKKKDINEDYQYFVDLGYSKSHIKEHLTRTMEYFRIPKELAPFFDKVNPGNIGEELHIYVEEVENEIEVEMCEELIDVCIKELEMQKKELDKKKKQIMKDNDIKMTKEMAGWIKYGRKLLRESDQLFGKIDFDFKDRYAGLFVD